MANEQDVSVKMLLQEILELLDHQDSSIPFIDWAHNAIYSTAFAENIITATKHLIKQQLAVCVYM